METSKALVFLKFTSIPDRRNNFFPGMLHPFRLEAYVNQLLS